MWIYVPPEAEESIRKAATGRRQQFMPKDKVVQ